MFLESFFLGSIPIKFSIVSTISSSHYDFRCPFKNVLVNTDIEDFRWRIFGTRLQKILP